MLGYSNCLIGISNIYLIDGFIEKEFLTYVQNVYFYEIYIVEPVMSSAKNI